MFILSQTLICKKTDVLHGRKKNYPGEPWDMTQLNLMTLKYSTVTKTGVTNIFTWNPRKYLCDNAIIHIFPDPRIPLLSYALMYLYIKLATRVINIEFIINTAFCNEKKLSQIKISYIKSIICCYLLPRRCHLYEYSKRFNALKIVKRIYFDYFTCMFCRYNDISITNKICERLSCATSYGYEHRLIIIRVAVYVVRFDLLTRHIAFFPTFMFND